MYTAKLLIVAIAALSSVGFHASAAEIHRFRTNEKRVQKKHAKHNEDVMDEEDVMFWTRLLNEGPDGRGKGTDLGSLPFVPRPPTNGGGGTNPRPPPPTRRPTPKPVPNPTRRPTPKPVPDPTNPPTRRPTPKPIQTPTPPAPTPPAPSPPAFRCPNPNFVGCTAPDQDNIQNECPTVGEPCGANGNPGEFCCVDGCPRNYCTAKQAPLRE
mmetsp:Transcript_33701/g.43396  ORF Transcript_33701/g.43396 Transcript_33701/m.43396 type:complete len:211 (+) Transcript_33701:105-737(+)